MMNKIGTKGILDDIEKIIFQLLDNWKNTQKEGGDENGRNFEARL